MVTWRRQGRPATAGGLLILGLAGLALLIVFADGIRRGLRPTYRIHVLVADAPNVRAGTPVTVAGLSAGRVARVALAPLDDDSVANAVLSLELLTGLGDRRELLTVERVALVRPVEAHIGNTVGDRDQNAVGHSGILTLPGRCGAGRETVGSED